MHVRTTMGALLWVDPVAHASECRRFDSYVVPGPGAEDCDLFTGAIGALALTAPLRPGAATRIPGPVKVVSAGYSVVSGPRELKGVIEPAGRAVAMSHLSPLQ